MNIEEAYNKAKLKANKNLGSNEASLDKARFVLLFNEVYPRYILSTIEEGNDERIREVSEFLKNTSLSLDSKKEDRYSYKLPSDYLEFSSARAKAKTSKCSNDLSLWEIKDKNYSQILSDEYNKPSFEYGESPFTIADNKINVFIDNFEVTEVVMSYYKLPKKIDIAGYVKDGKATVNIDPEGSDRIVNKVINMVVLEHARNNKDYEDINVNKDRIINNT